jgi:hypothetical protein
MMALATSAPAPTGASVNGVTLTITFAGTHGLDTTATPANSNFTVDVGAPTELEPVVTGVAITATTVILTLDEAIPHTATGVTVSYAGTALVCDDDSDAPTSQAAVADFTNYAVTVTTPPPSTEDHEGGGGILLPTTSYTQLREATLPTSAGFNFVLDPQGLYYLTDEQIEALVVEPVAGSRRLGEIVIDVECTASNCPDHDDGDGTGTCNETTKWELLESAGQIIFSDYAPYFINNSNFDVALEIEFSFDAGATSNVVAIDDPADIDDNTDRNVFIGATFSSNNIRTAPTTFAGNITLPVLAPDSGDGQKPLFVLGAADYTDETTVTRHTTTDVITAIAVAQRKVKAAGDTGNGTQFTLSGICNPKANWTGLVAADLKVNITFELTMPAATDWSFAAGTYPGAAISGAPGLIAGNDLATADFIPWTIPVMGPTTPPVVTPTVGFQSSTFTYPATANTWFKVPFNYGTNSGPTAVTSVTANGNAQTAGTSFRANIVLQGEGMIEFMFASHTVVRVIVVTLDDGTSSTITLNP